MTTAGKPYTSQRPATDEAVQWPARRSLFGVMVSVTNYEEAVACIMQAARRGQSAVVSAHPVHGIVSASGDRKLRRRVNSFEILAPDGQPVRWALNRLYNAGLQERVYGPELMLRLCGAAATAGIGIYLLGSTDRVIASLQDKLLTRFPRLQIAGVEAPPFRPLTAEEDAALVERINGSGASLVFLGLGCPKQDHFAFEHRDQIRGVQLCVGAAFDFLSGSKPMAPSWMQRRGLEWLFRLRQEPRRLWRRYAVTNSIFTVRFAGAWLAGCWKRSKHGIARRNPVQDEAGACGTIDTARAQREGAIRDGQPPVRGTCIADSSDPQAASETAGPSRLVSIIVPCYMEQDGVLQLKSRLQSLEELLCATYHVEFVLVDDGSTDDTWPRLQDAFAACERYHVLRHQKNKGVAAAILTGAKHSKAPVICSIDADCSYDPALLVEMIPQLAGGVAMVTASPYHPQGSCPEVPGWRLLLSRSASCLYGLVLRQKLFTYTSCFRVYRGDVLRRIQLAHPGFVGIAELLWHFDRQGLPIAEHPAELAVRKLGSSKMRLARTVLGHLRLLARCAGDRLMSTRGSTASSHSPRYDAPSPERAPAATASSAVGSAIRPDSHAPYPVLTSSSASKANRVNP